MNERDPNKTLPPRPGPTETQRFTPVNPDDTNPHLRIAPFPKPGAAPEQPPSIEFGFKHIPGAVYAYGGMELHDVSRLDDGDYRGVDGNGIPYIVPKEEFEREYTRKSE